ncbi:unnamed protein product [Brassicogethes aeneus]|uniref:Uncharacterized protein n=1 Tax=Brassicogethes aeneus TaxID=1431903 RepID=A0A9P0AYB3_BRAAE|nr:unnamed protein product [Brassicogethes aeneus]
MPPKAVQSCQSCTSLTEIINELKNVINALKIEVESLKSKVEELGKSEQTKGLELEEIIQESLSSSLTTEDFIETQENPDQPTSSDESLAIDISNGKFCNNFKKMKERLHHSQSRKDRAEAIKSDFQNNLPGTVTVHWDGKLLPGLDERSSKEERLPILISFGEKEQLLAVPKLESSSGQDQAKARGQSTNNVL